MGSAKSSCVFRQERTVPLLLLSLLLLTVARSSNAASLPFHPRRGGLLLVPATGIPSLTTSISSSTAFKQNKRATNNQHNNNNAVNSNNPIRFFLRSLWKGVTLPFPALRKLVLGGESSSSSTSGVRTSVAALLSYLTVGVVSYHKVLEPQWTLVDALYFSVTSFTTVGYGDLVPTTAASKAFTCVFGLVGVAFLGAAIATVSSSLLESEMQALKDAKASSRKRFQQVFDDMPDALKTFRLVPDNEQKAHFEQAQQTKTTTPAAMADDSSPAVWRSVLPSLVLIFAGGALVHRLNGGSGPWWDAIYYSVITASTIGLGDISPLTRPARMAAVIYIPIAVAAAGDLLSGAASALLERRQLAVHQEHLEQMLTITRLHEMDQDRSGRISRAEFLKFMLLEMELVEVDELRELDAQFDRLDTDQTGFLDTKDLELMAKYRGVPVATSNNEMTTATE